MRSKDSVIAFTEAESNVRGYAAIVYPIFFSSFGDRTGVALIKCLSESNERMDKNNAMSGEDVIQRTKI